MSIYDSTCHIRNLPLLLDLPYQFVTNFQFNSQNQSQRTCFNQNSNFVYYSLPSFSSIDWEVKDMMRIDFPVISLRSTYAEIRQIITKYKDQTLIPVVSDRCVLFFSSFFSNLII